jgi:Tn3 transposase DDE domain
MRRRASSSLSSLTFLWTALRLGTAETEAILRRFTKKNLQHPTYKAFAELGKAIKTIFLCRYLHSEALRREIHDGLNVVEQWNGATDFVFFARHGEMASNRREDHEISMLALHLIQNCMVYINTLMIQKLLAQPQGKLTPRLLITEVLEGEPLTYAKPSRAAAVSSSRNEFAKCHMFARPADKPQMDRAPSGHPSRKLREQGRVRI